MQVTGSNNKYFTYKCALVPSQFFNAAQARAMLVETVDVDTADEVAYIEIPKYEATLIYVKEEQGRLPELYYMLDAAEDIKEYNKIVASYDGTRLYLVVVRDRTLLLCNSYAAMDFVTAEYFIFLAMKTFQLNPEISTLYFRTELAPEEEMSLYSYFKSVEKI